MKKMLLSLIAASLIYSSISGLSMINAQGSSVKGDVNSDGVFNAADILLFKKWIFGGSDIDMNIIKSADLNNDGIANIVDFCLMKDALLDAEPVSPVLPVNAQPIECDDIDEVKKIINAADVSAYPENYRDAYSEMFRSFKDDRCIYQIIEDTKDDEGIKLIPQRGIALMPYAEFEDTGILYHVEYKGENYSVFINFIDPQYSGQFGTMSEYSDLRFKFRNFQEVDEQTITAHFAGEDGTQIISYRLLSANKYCKVQTNASDEKLTEFMSQLTSVIRRRILTTPLLLIQERNSNGEFYNSVITEDGDRYTAGAIYVPPGKNWTFDDDIAYTICEGEKEFYIQDTEVLQKISYFSNNASKYTDCKMTYTDFRVTDGCEISLQLLYSDEKGTLNFLGIYNAYSGSSGWRENKEIQEFVRMMIKRGYIGREDFLDAVDKDDQKTNDPYNESELPEN